MSTWGIYAQLGYRCNLKYLPDLPKLAVNFIGSTDCGQTCRQTCRHADMYKHVSIQLQLRCSVYKTKMQATLPYEFETWAVSPTSSLRYLDATEMRCLSCRMEMPNCLRKKMTSPSNLELTQCVDDHMILVRSCNFVRYIYFRILYRILKWLGHLAGKANDSLPIHKQLAVDTMQ